MSEYSALISRWGYIGVLLGTLLEGETTVLVAGIFAKLGYLKLKGILLCASLGTYVGDCLFFFLGKHCGRPIIERYDFLKRKVALSDKIIHKYGNHLFFAIRFLAGFRSIILLLLGCANFRSRRFLTLDLLSSVIWSAVIGLCGYLSANLVYIFVDDIKKYEHTLIPLLMVLGVFGIFFYRRYVRDKEKEQFHGD